MKKIVFLLSLLLVPCLLACSSNSKEKTLEKYLTYYFNNEMEKAYNMLSSEDKKFISCKEFITRNQFQGIASLIMANASYKIISFEEQKNITVAKVEIIKANEIKIFGSLMQLSMNTKNKSELTEQERQEFIKNIPTIVVIEEYKLIQENNEWKIYLNYKNKKEELEKLKQQIKLSDLIVKKYRIFSSEPKIPGTEYKIQNNSDKVITNLELTFYFKNEDNQIIYEEVKRVVYSQNPLKPGYITQVEKGRVSTFDNVPSEWEEGNYEVKITKIETE